MPLTNPRNMLSMQSTSLRLFSRLFLHTLFNLFLDINRFAFGGDIVNGKGYFYETVFFFQRIVVEAFVFLYLQ